MKFQHFFFSVVCALVCLSGVSLSTGITRAKIRVASITPLRTNTPRPVASTNTPIQPTSTPTRTTSTSIQPKNTPIQLPRGEGSSVSTSSGYYPFRLAQIPEQGNGEVVQIALGANHALGLKRSGLVFGWGTNIKGELYVPIQAQSNVVQVAVGQNFSVALKNTGTVVFWGDRSVIPSPTDASIPTDVIMIAAGNQHTLLLRANGQVVVVGATDQKAIPSALSTKTVVSIAAGATSSMALTSEGATYIWGRTQTIPDLAKGSIRKIWADGQLFAALRSDGRLVVFGHTTTLAAEPALTANTLTTSEPGCPCTVVGGMTNLEEFQAASWGAVLRKTNNGVFGLGYMSNASIPKVLVENAKGIAFHQSISSGLMLSDDMSKATHTPTLFPSPAALLSVRSAQNKKYMGSVGYNGSIGAPDTFACQFFSCNTLVRQVVAGPDYAAILLNDHSVLAWRQPNTSYRFGQMTIPVSLQTSFEPNDPLRVVTLAAGGSHMLALRANGTVVAWGNNTSGQTTIPVGLSGVVHIAAGQSHSVALLNTGRVIAWGDNSFGQLNVPNMENVVNISAGGYHTIALRSNGSVVGWGRNSDGQTNFPLTFNVVDIAANLYNSVLLSSDGVVTVYGNAQYGQTTIPEGRYSQIAAGGMSIMALDTTGDPVGWGLSVSDNFVFPQWDSTRADCDTSCKTPNISSMALGSNFGVYTWSSLNVEDNTQFVATRTFTKTPTWGFPRQIPTLTLVPRGTTYEISQDRLTTSSVARGFVANGMNSLKAYVTSESGFMTLEGDASCAAGQGDCGPLPINDAAVCNLPMWDGYNVPRWWLTDVKDVKFSQTAGFMLKQKGFLWTWTGCPEFDGFTIKQSTLHPSDKPIPPEFLSNVKAFDVDQTKKPAMNYSPANIIILRDDNNLWSSKCAFPTFKKTIIDVALTDAYCAVLFEDGTVWTSDPVIAVPTGYPPLVDIELGAKVTYTGNAAFSTEYVYGLGLTQTGEVIGWGDVSRKDEVLDIPLDARASVIDIDVSQTQNVALRSDGKVVIWGSPYGTGKQSLWEPINTQSAASFVNVGFGGTINILAEGAGQSLPPVVFTAMPTATVPRRTVVRVNDNMVGGYDFDSLPPMTQFQFPGQNALTTSCRNPFCPEVIYQKADSDTAPFYALKFRESKGDELTTTSAVNLSGDFTIEVLMRRDRPYREDVAVSAGIPGQFRRYLTIGVDRENRPYCSFFGDDLRGSPLTLDREAAMHGYACSYNATTRERILSRNGRVIAKDIASGPFIVPNSPLLIGRRADTMAGLDGVIASVRFWPSVVTTNGVFAESLSPASIQFPGILPGQRPFECESTSLCPNIVQDSSDAHDGGYLGFVRGNSLSMPMPANANTFTFSLWMNLSELYTWERMGSVFARLNSDQTGIVMRMHAGNLWCGKLIASGGTIQYEAKAEATSMVISQGWHMYTCAISNNLMELYIDGNKVAQQAITPATYATTVVIGQVPGVAVTDCTYMLPMFCNMLRYPIDDVYIYQEALSAQRIRDLYNETARIPAIPTQTPDPLISSTPTPIRSATATFTRTPTEFTRTRIPATLTMTVPPTETSTRTFTLTRTSTVTRTFTRTTTPSATITPTRPTSTVYLSPTNSMTRTRTALAITRTWMARRSPTFAVQTMTAVARSANQTATALRLTQTAVVVGTPTNTATAYPVPSTETPLPTGYPTP